MTKSKPAHTIDGETSPAIDTSALIRAIDLMRTTSEDALTHRAIASFMDSEERIARPGELRKSIFLKGLAHEERAVIWPMLAGVIDWTATSAQRAAAITDIHGRYYAMKDGWMKQSSADNADILNHLRTITKVSV